MNNKLLNHMMKRVSGGMGNGEDIGVKVRMAAAEIEGVLEKYGLHMRVVEVSVDGKQLMRSIQLMERKVITGCSLQFNFADAPPATPTPPPQDG